MKELFLIKIGEIALKKGNKNLFEKRLKKNIKRAIHPAPSQMSVRSNRWYLETEEIERADVLNKLSKVFGIIGIYPAIRCKKDWEVIREKALELFLDQKPEGLGFKADVRRIDKSFPMSSYEMECELGGIVLDSDDKYYVNVKKSEWKLCVEVRDHTYIYLTGTPGQGGLPVGIAGKGMALLSGGIDSPVACWRMARRGLKMDVIYFHTPPYTSDEAKDKVVRLAKTVSPWLNGVVLHIIDFTEMQLRINQEAELSYRTLMARACMMKLAEKLSEKRGCESLVTGEALSQVASQTMRSIQFTQSMVTLPVFRPLIGMDKEEIITTARMIDSYEISIEPFDDCCSLFSPDHPQTKPDLEIGKKEFEKVWDEEMAEKALENAEKFLL